MAQGTHHPGVADQNAIARKARDLAKKTADGDRLTVEFSSEPPALTPGAAPEACGTGKSPGDLRGAHPADPEHGHFACQHIPA
jgi:hypothetical protein